MDRYVTNEDFKNHSRQCVERMITGRSAIHLDGADPSIPNEWSNFAHALMLVHN